MSISTTRNDGFPKKPTLEQMAPGWGIMSKSMLEKRVWNLEGTYRVHSQSFDFLNLLQRLGGAALPHKDHRERLVSPEASSTSAISPHGKTSG